MLDDGTNKFHQQNLAGPLICCLRLTKRKNVKKRRKPELNLFKYSNRWKEASDHFNPKVIHGLTLKMLFLLLLIVLLVIAAAAEVVLPITNILELISSI